jgi:hypothetical protein
MSVPELTSVYVYRSVEKGENTLVDVLSISVLCWQLAARTTAVFSSPRKTAFVYTALPRFLSMSASAFDAKYENILMSRS